MIISALLTAFMLASMAVGVVMRRRSPAVALALMLASLAGIWFAWMPQQLTAVANALGVGRGTDLALYLWVSISFLALAGLALQLRHLQGQLTILVREIAILIIAFRRFDLVFPQRLPAFLAGQVRGLGQRSGIAGSTGVPLPDEVR